MIPGIDVSHWQGTINWSAVAQTQQFVIVKISGGDAGLYYDAQASNNYYGAKAAGIQGVGGYHFAGGGNPSQEADFFCAGMKPWTENDVWVLDWEIDVADPVSWVGQFMQRCHDVAGVWPLLYVDGSRANAYNWNANAAVANCGKWIAWYGRDPSQDLPVSMFYTMMQYSSSGKINGISGNVDQDMFYGDISQLQKYGWHAPVAPPAPVVTTGTVVTTQDVPFNSVSQNTDLLPEGTSQVSQTGQVGTETFTYTVTYTDGAETNRVLMSDVITVQPVDQVTLVGTMVNVPTGPSGPTGASGPSGPTGATGPIVVVTTPTENANAFIKALTAIVNFIKSIFGKKPYVS